MSSRWGLAFSLPPGFARRSVILGRLLCGAGFPVCRPVPGSLWRTLVRLEAA